MESPKPILFTDFDGVVVNSPEVWHAYWQQWLLKNRDGASFTLEEMQDIFQHNVWESMEERFGITPDEKEVFSKWQRSLAEKPEDWGEIFEDVPELYEDLHKKFNIRIITSNQRTVVQAVLEHHELGDSFDEIHGRNEPGNKTKKMRKILKEKGQKPEETYIITDTIGDIREAQALGMKSIGVTWGLHTKEHLQGAGADIICDTVQQVRDALLD